MLFGVVRYDCNTNRLEVKIEGLFQIFYLRFFKGRQCFKTKICKVCLGMFSLLSFVLEETPIFFFRIQNLSLLLIVSFIISQPPNFQLVLTLLTLKSCRKLQFERVQINNRNLNGAG